MTFPDTREALKDLLNVTSIAPFYGGAPLAEAAAFISRHGPLRAFPLPQEMLEKMKADPNDPRVAVCILSGAFSGVLSIRDKGEAARLLINGVLAAIFMPASIDGKERQAALKIDILDGIVEPVPRDLTDAIAVEFMRAFKNIGRCERCRRYYFKTYTSDRYCSRLCAQKTRSEAQRDWMRESRAKTKSKKASSSQKTRRAS